MIRRRRRVRSPYDAASLPVGRACFAPLVPTAAELVSRTVHTDEVPVAA